MDEELRATAGPDAGKPVGAWTFATVLEIVTDLYDLAGRYGDEVQALLGEIKGLIRKYRDKWNE